MTEWEALWQACKEEVSPRRSCTQRLREHLLAHLVCPGRHTVSALIMVFGKQFQDWTADYSLYAKDRVDEEVIFRQVRKEVEALGQPGRPLCLALDDTILRKTGKAIPGAAYRKDPLGPAFHLNLVWAQRRLQLNAAVVDENHDVRLVPLAFQDASTPRKPRKSASPETRHAYQEQMRISVQARVNGKERSFEVKTVTPLRWRAAGEWDLRLVVIRPVGYLPRQGARKAYTQPAYLICTDVNLPLENLIQEYVWRWDIEVNHRDEKTILGIGQAQVRNENSVASIPATAVAAYAMLLLAAIKAYGQGGKPTVIPEAKWRRPWKKIRPSTQYLLNKLRRELWAQAIRPDHLTDFLHTARHRTKPLKSEPNLCSTLFAATA